MQTKQPVSHCKRRPLVVSLSEDNPMKMEVYVCRDGGRHRLFYCHPRLGWRFIIDGGGWISAPFVKEIFDNHTVHVVNNFKEKH